MTSTKAILLTCLLIAILLGTEIFSIARAWSSDELGAELKIRLWNVGDEVIESLSDVERFPGLVLNSRDPELIDYDIMLLLVYEDDPNEQNFKDLFNISDEEYQNVMSGEAVVTVELFYPIERKKVRVFVLNGPMLLELSPRCQAVAFYKLFRTVDFDDPDIMNIMAKLNCIES